MRFPKLYKIVVILSLALYLIGCNKPHSITKISGPTMGTEYHISWVTVLTNEGDVAAERIKIKKMVNQLLVDFNKSMSTYDPQSELSIINKQFVDEWQVISPGLHRVLSMAMQVNHQSLGAFDVTVGPLVNLWGFGPEKSNDRIPDEAKIAQRLALVGSGVISLRQQGERFELKLAEKRYIDLSAIAKGDAVDVIGHLLQQQGIENYLVEVGGEIIANGSKAKNAPWRIAIEAPNDDGRSVQIIIPLSNMGIATSGDYRNFFEQNGRRFSHTIDSRTGYPVSHKLASVSVLHDSVAIADAWATALTVLGADAGLALTEKYNLAAYFIVRTDSGFKQLTSSHFDQLTLK